MDYDYLNARIRSMKGRLLSPQALEGLIQRPDLEGIIAELERSPYRAELERARLQYTGIQAVEEALRKDMAATFRRILSLARGDEPEKYVQRLLARWDVQNIKTILRGKAMHIPPTEILECLVPAGDLDEAALAELLKQPDVKGVIDLLATWRIRFARPLMLSLGQFQENRDPAVLEYALDRFAFESALDPQEEDESEDDDIMRRLVRTEIEVINLKTAFRLIRDGIPPDEARSIVIAGGRSPDTELILSLIGTGSIEAAAKMLGETPYRFLSEVPAAEAKAGISAYERELDRYLLRKGLSHFLKDPLSIAPAIGFSWAKQTEVTNLRIIARGRSMDMPEKEIRGEMIHV
jgi:V/A-type H+/Na+-transporting ATPase subunit C